MKPDSTICFSLLFREDAGSQAHLVFKEGQTGINGPCWCAGLNTADLSAGIKLVKVILLATEFVFYLSLLYC